MTTNPRAAGGDDGMIWFMVWMLGFPLVCAVEKYVIAMRSKLEGKPATKDVAWGFVGLCELVLYVWVAQKLWQIRQ